MDTTSFSNYVTAPDFCQKVTAGKHCHTISFRYISSNVTKQNGTTEVIMIAGMGNRTSASVMPPMLREQCDALGYTAHSVEGVTTAADGSLETSPPSAQTQEVDSIVANTEPETRVLLVAHCVGAVAAVNYLEANDNPNVRGVLIAPPLTTPLATINHDQVQRRVEEHDGDPHIAVLDFPSDDPYNFDRLVETKARITPRFLDEITAASSNDDFLRRATALAQTGRLGIVVPSGDWNEGALAAAAYWPGEALQIDGAKHALNMPDRLLDSQRANCDTTLQFGVGLWEAQAFQK